MTLWQPTRRELIQTAPAALAAAALPRTVWARPGGDPLRFMVLGDWGRRGQHAQKAVAKWMEHTAGRGAKFVVTTGDNFYTFGVRDKHDSHWRESYLDVYRDLVRMPWFPSMGNHDYTGNPNAILGGYDGTGWWMPARNYIIKGSLLGHQHVDLFIVDVTMWEGGNGFPQSIVSRKPGRGTLPSVRRWLAEELAQSRAPIKLVFGHHGIYSVGGHGGAWERRELAEVMKNGGASAYIHGHDHCLFHIQDPQLDYICSGGGSRIDKPKEFKGGLGEGCVFPEQCPPTIFKEKFVQPPAGSPVYKRYERSAGFAYFEVWPNRVQFSFIGPELNGTYTAEIPIRSRPSSST